MNETISRAGTGYDPAFLGTEIPVPALDDSIKDDVIPWHDSAVIPYTHFSLTLSKERRFARWVGWNIDGARITMLSRSSLGFSKDPRLPRTAQVGNELYSKNHLDRGHIARRADLIWGDLPEASAANRDSFYYSNITPQLDDFNQSKQQGIWGLLENALFEDVEVENLKVSVFGGPVFGADDPIYRKTAIPHEYWKLLVYQDHGTLKSRTFLLTQDLNRLRTLLALDEFRVYQISLDELEQRSHLGFSQNLHAVTAQGSRSLRPASRRTPLKGTADISW